LNPAVRGVIDRKRATRSFSDRGSWLSELDHSKKRKKTVPPTIRVNVIASTIFVWRESRFQ
jgi:hypothetical protein